MCPTCSPHIQLVHLVVACPCSQPLGSLAVQVTPEHTHSSSSRAFLSACWSVCLLKYARYILHPCSCKSQQKAVNVRGPDALALMLPEP
jgi:hypothetical protein